MHIQALGWKKQTQAHAFGLFVSGSRGNTPQLESPKFQATDKPQRTLVPTDSGGPMSVSRKLGEPGEMEPFEVLVLGPSQSLHFSSIN